MGSRDPQCVPPRVSPSFGLWWQQGQGQRVPWPLPRVQGVTCGCGIRDPLPPSPWGCASSCPCPQAAEGPSLGRQVPLNPMAAAHAPILGTLGSKWPGLGGTRAQFLPLPGPKVSSQTPKNSRELVFSLLPPALPRAGPPRLVSPGGDKPWIPWDGCPPPRLGHPAGHGSPGTDGPFVSQTSPWGARAPTHTHSPGLGGDEGGRDCHLSPHPPGCQCPKSAQPCSPHALPAPP